MPERVTDADLVRWEALHEAATIAPWDVVADQHHAWGIEGGGDTVVGQAVGFDCRCAGVLDEDDATFIAESRTALPALVAEVRRLRAALSTIRDIADRPGVVQIAKDALAEDKEVL